jgi:prophage tail gpP-like protein
LEIFADNISEKGLCKNQAKWIAWNRGCLSRLYKYSISGWKTSGSELWDINKLVKVKDNWFDIDDTMLIINVDFYLSGGQSARTDITVVDKKMFSFSSDIVNVKMKAFDV